MIEKAMQGTVRRKSDIKFSEGVHGRET